MGAGQVVASGCSPGVGCSCPLHIGRVSLMLGSSGWPRQIASATCAPQTLSRSEAFILCPVGTAPQAVHGGAGPVIIFGYETVAGSLPDASAPWNVARRRPICRRRICRRPIGRRPICSADNRSTIGAERVQHATARVVGPRQGPQALTDRAIGAGEAAGFAT